MHLNSFFQGNLRSLLTNPGYEPSTSNVEELRRSDVLSVMTFVNHKRRIEAINDSISRKLYEKTNLIKHGNVTAMFEFMIKYKNVSLTSFKNIYNYLEEYKSKVKIIGNEYLLNMEASYVMRKGHPLLPNIDYIIQLMKESGVQKKWLSDMVTRKFDAHHKDYEDVVLKFKHLQAAFYCLEIGLMISMVVFIFEVISKYY